MLGSLSQCEQTWFWRMTVKSVDSESLHSSTQPPHTSRPRRPLEGEERQMSKAYRKEVVVLGQGLEDFHYFTYF